MGRTVKAGKDALASKRDGTWTVVQLRERRPITRETVKELLRDDDLHDLARVALKYAQK